jgi:pimeloyl-ACP methyl ester carboxylesterase
MARAMKAQMPRAFFSEIPNAGHISNVEQAELFNQSLAAFYTRTGFLS